MMDFKEFTEKVKKGLEELENEYTEIVVEERLKNNGLKLTGISMLQKGENVSPVVYLEPHYQRYMVGDCTITEAVEHVAELLKDYSQTADIEAEVEGFENWNRIRPRVFAKLINAEMNRELLQRVPHRMFMDLAVVYYVKVKEFMGGGAGTILASNQHLQIWGVDENRMYETALSNMEEEGASIQGMDEILGDMENSPVPNFCGMYVLTNRSKLFGASELLRLDTLREIAGKLQDNLMILPSSLHEVIILPEKESPSGKEAAEMVKAVNDSELAPDEILSDHVYRFDRGREEIYIAA